MSAVKCYTHKLLSTLPRIFLCFCLQVYYWDSYWIVIGLLHCEMFDTVKGMLLNFVHLVKVIIKSLYCCTIHYPVLFAVILSECSICY